MISQSAILLILVLALIPVVSAFSSNSKCSVSGIRTASCLNSFCATTPTSLRMVFNDPPTKSITLAKGIALTLPATSAFSSSTT